MAWPDDPEQRKVREAQERERLHMAYCRGDVQWKERVLNKDDGAPRSPYGPCPSLIGSVNHQHRRQQEIAAAQGDGRAASWRGLFAMR